MTYGDKNNPLRCSKLAHMVKCTARIYMLEAAADEDDAGGEAAQNGSLTHVGVAAFHKHRGKLLDRKAEAWEAIKNAAGMFPLAQTQEVRLFLTPYMDDPRNQERKIARNKDGVEGIEIEVAFTLPPHPFDKTKEPIYVTGRIDQIWDEGGTQPVSDLKTGKKTAWEMIHDHAIQLAAYVLGARQYGFVNAVPGRIIRNYSYRVRGCALPSPDGVFLALPFQFKHIEYILEPVRRTVAMIRNGYVDVSPGPHCTFCEHGGLANCIPKLEQLTTKPKKS